MSIYTGFHINSKETIGTVSVLIPKLDYDGASTFNFSGVDIFIEDPTTGRAFAAAVLEACEMLEREREREGQGNG